MLTLHFKTEMLALYLALQFHPAALLLGLHLLGLVLFDALQETVSALRVLHVLNAHVDPLGQDSAPVKQNRVHCSKTFNGKVFIFSNSLFAAATCCDLFDSSLIQNIL